MNGANDDITTERELLLLALGPATARTAARIRGLAGSAPNWDELLWDTHWHRTTAPLGRALRASAPDLMPARVADLLRRHARATATYALHQIQLLRKASQCLDALGIPSAAGRGPLLAQAYYGDAAARDPVKPPDLWILPGDRDQATDALLTAGLELHPGDGPARFEQRVHPDGGRHRFELRLRTQESRSSGARVDAAMLERSRSAVPPIRILDRADMLFLLAAPLAARPWRRAQALADFTAVLRGATAADVEAAVQRAGAGPLGMAMQLARALTADLPASRPAPPPEIDPALFDLSRRLLRGRARPTAADLERYRRLVSPTPATPPAAAVDRAGDLGEFSPNDVAIIDAMLDLAGARSSDVLYDLGCGDGRVMIRAAQRHGLRAIGIEWDPDRVEEARCRVRDAGVAGLVEVRQGDVHTCDVSDATVVYTYLRGVQTALLPRLRGELRPGTRLVSRDFDYGEWPPVRTEVLPLEPCGPPVWLFRWSIGSPASGRRTGSNTALGS
ncbi:MAG: nucleotidyltransferase family protein [Acidobacteriota bacterium]